MEIYKIEVILSQQSYPKLFLDSLQKRSSTEKRQAQRRPEPRILDELDQMPLPIYVCSIWLALRQQRQQ